MVTAAMKLKDACSLEEKKRVFIILTSDTKWEIMPEIQPPSRVWKGGSEENKTIYVLIMIEAGL